MKKNHDTAYFDDKRAHPRRNQDMVIAKIDDTAYPIKDWSQGGAYIYGDFRIYERNESVKTTLIFKAAETVSEAMVTSRVVRRTEDGMAIQFSDVPKSSQTIFNSIIAA